ncbi:MAG: hydrogen peroxide-inducible genes activator [Deltaproteobacteria bacterium]|nr:hydrogen peroxide-inducible genes activator [Deltaproteobacteria bacterium]
MPTLTQLTYIIAVDEHKNFTRAARACHVSQPSLSDQIQKIEEELDLIIFDRSQKPIITTAQGLEVIKQEARKLVDVGRQKKTPAGYFHLGVIPTISPYLIPLFIDAFAQSYPDVHLKITELTTDQIITHLYDDKIDAGLLVTPLYNHQLIERVLFYEQFYAFVAKNHPLYPKSIVTQNLLDQDSIWLLDEGHCLRNQVIDICAVSQNANTTHNIRFASGSLDTLINLVRKGHGYTLLPELATHGLLATERKYQLKPFRKPTPTREVSLVHARSFLKESIIDALQQSILEHLPPDIPSQKKKSIQIIDI